MIGIDLFAGAGGTSLGAKRAGVNISWAANHNPKAVEYHSINHPEVEHACQDLQQADWSLVPNHDLTLASPCCQGHSKASGTAKKSIKADKSRSTAWAVVDCLDAHRSPLAIIENVECFLKWDLFEAWEFAMKKMGYSLSINHVNAADLGIPQNRPRIFIVATRSKNPIALNLPKVDHVPARTFIDTSFEGHKWDLVSNRVIATQNRVKHGRKKFGDVFLDAAYSGELGGRSLDKPVGTITTVNKHSLVMGEYIRPLTIKEMAVAQTFPDDYQFPAGATITKEMIGNAVPPVMAEKVIKAVLANA
ncbi:DNA cytosine methyltransferase [Pseudoalteromonas sp. S554]|uniref:DNA cytosine methyltransferase n=1 Tax=Pseudoalteromonas sp. S554 TaxID=2066516 RepID=UPI00110D12C4|nr:DNA cytosine methyltransferase [Pseudoalteromonas sp. S554]TMS80563.1 DNA (cytosine-5-)-methyltransferase [Pseudoalteromonas sp. S554]